MLTKELSTAERMSLRFIEPMYAESVHELPDGGLWTYEAKFDDYWSLAAKSGTDSRSASRRSPRRREGQDRYERRQYAS
jgi:ATP-dependent DNA ligase